MSAQPRAWIIFSPSGESTKPATFERARDRACQRAKVDRVRALDWSRDQWGDARCYAAGDYFLVRNDIVHQLTARRRQSENERRG